MIATWIFLLVSAAPAPVTTFQLIVRLPDGTAAINSTITAEHATPGVDRDWHPARVVVDRGIATVSYPSGNSVRVVARRPGSIPAILFHGGDAGGWRARDGRLRRRLAITLRQAETLQGLVTTNDGSAPSGTNRLYLEGLADTYEIGQPTRLGKLMIPLRIEPDGYWNCSEWNPGHSKQDHAKLLGDEFFSADKVNDPSTAKISGRVWAVLSAGQSETHVPIRFHGEAKSRLRVRLPKVREISVRVVPDGSGEATRNSRVSQSAVAVYHVASPAKGERLTDAEVSRLENSGSPLGPVARILGLGTPFAPPSEPSALFRWSRDGWHAPTAFMQSIPSFPELSPTTVHTAGPDDVCRVPVIVDGGGTVLIGAARVPARATRMTCQAFLDGKASDGTGVADGQLTLRAPFDEPTSIRVRTAFGRPVENARIMCFNAAPVQALIDELIGSRSVSGTSVDSRRSRRIGAHGRLDSYADSFKNAPRTNRRGVVLLDVSPPPGSEFDILDAQGLSIGAVGGAGSHVVIAEGAFSVTGRVIDADTTKPIKNFRVLVREGWYGTYSELEDPQQNLIKEQEWNYYAAAEQRFDDGSFEIQGFIPDASRLQFRILADGYVPAIAAEINEKVKKRKGLTVRLRSR